MAATAYRARTYGSAQTATASPTPAPTPTSPVVPVAVGAGLGATLGFMHTKGEFPGTLEIGKTLSNPWVWALIAAYFAAGYGILWLFLRPQTVEAKAAWLGTGFLWNTF